uniref:Uncharacterized protein n=1 Tax=Hyaloperonospora arabidopsidis (strain Emoy2) TaxID=559515 RepID=M4B9N8_HYAAE
MHLSSWRSTRSSTPLVKGVLQVVAFEDLRQRRTWSVSAFLNLVIARPFAARLLQFSLSPSRTFQSRS